MKRYSPPSRREERKREREIYFTSAGHMRAKPLRGKGRPGCLRQG